MAQDTVSPGLILRRGQVEASLGGVTLPLPSRLYFEPFGQNVAELALASRATTGTATGATAPTTWSLAGFRGDFEDAPFAGVTGKLRLPSRFELSSTVLQTQEATADRATATLTAQLPLSPGVNLALEGAQSNTDDAAGPSQALSAELTAQGKRAYANLIWWKVEARFRSPFLLDDLDGDGAVDRGRFWGSYDFTDSAYTTLYVLKHRDATATTLKETSTVAVSLDRRFQPGTLEGRVEWYTDHNTAIDLETRERTLDLVWRPQTEFKLGALKPRLWGEVAGGYTWQDRIGLSGPVTPAAVTGPNSWATLALALTPDHVVTVRWEKYWNTDDTYKTELEYWWRF